MSLGSPPPYPPPVPPQGQNLDDSALEFDDLDSEYPSSHHRSSRRKLSVPNNIIDAPQFYHPSPSSSLTVAQSPLEVLRARLAPLRHVEALLISKLVQPDEDEAAAHFDPAVAMSNAFDELPSPTTSHFTHYPRSRNNHFHNQEISVRPGPGWKGVLSRARVDLGIAGVGSTTGQLTRNSSKEIRDEAQEMLYSCRKDMMHLWHDPVVKEILRRRKIRLEESSGLWVAFRIAVDVFSLTHLGIFSFLDDLERVTSLKYLPSDDDVLKARLKTVGVSEYKFEMEIRAGRDSVSEWRIIDVGGSRSQRREPISPFL